MKYQRATDIEDIELAGCLDIANSAGNYNTMVHRLKLILAICYNTLKAEEFLRQIEEEAEECFLPYHEYVINELQYEYRFSSKLKFNEKYENEVLSKWAKTIILKYNMAVAEEFLGSIKINRSNRQR